MENPPGHSSVLNHIQEAWNIFPVIGKGSVTFSSIQIMARELCSICLSNYTRNIFYACFHQKIQYL